MSRIERVRATLKKGGAVFIRAAEPDDVAAIRAFDAHMLVNNAFGVREPGESERSEAEERTRIERFVREPGWLMLTAWTANRHAELVGTLSFRNGDRRKLAHHGSFGVAVHGEWRGRGVGAAMIHSLLAWAVANRQIEKVSLGVFETNADARRLYERLGFVEESRSPRHFKLGPGRYVDDVRMSLFVKPGVAPQPFKTWPLPEPPKRQPKPPAPQAKPVPQPAPPASVAAERTTASSAQAPQPAPVSVPVPNPAS
ncbi:MAG: GNAT family N-acetyltransferase [Phycisphaerales bacterium]